MRHHPSPTEPPSRNDWPESQGQVTVSLDDLGVARAAFVAVPTSALCSKKRSKSSNASEVSSFAASCLGFRAEACERWAFALAP